MNFILLLNMKMPTVFGFFIFISGEILSYSRKEFEIVCTLRFISRTNFMLRGFEQEKHFLTLVPEHNYVHEGPTTVIDSQTSPF